MVFLFIPIPAGDDAKLQIKSKKKTLRLLRAVVKQRRKIFQTQILIENKINQIDTWELLIFQRRVIDFGLIQGWIALSPTSELKQLDSSLKIHKLKPTILISLSLSHTSFSSQF